MSVKKPKVSIGIPVYNGTDYLGQALDSILAQTFSDFEVVISDNGSTDETVALCQAYAERDHRIIFTANDVNRGATWNYNHVFDMAQGDYFRWHGHDDVIAPTYLERCVSVLDADPSVVVAYPRSAIIDGNGDVIRLHEDGMDIRSARVDQRIRNFAPGLCHPVFGLIRRSALMQTDRIGNYVSSDEMLLWQLLLAGKFHEVPEVLFYRRFHEKASVVANPDFSSRAQWFDPKKKTRFYFKTWHQFYKKLLAIGSADLPAPDKARAYGEFARFYATQPGFVIQDFRFLYEHISARRKAGKPTYWTEFSSSGTDNTA